MTYRQFRQQLSSFYPEGEASTIARIVFEDCFAMSLEDICMGKDLNMSKSDDDKTREILHRLQQYEPVQYVTGKALFCNRDFIVKPGVLIPRPETAELTAWAIEILQKKDGRPCVLDAGTGSGCIAITIKKEVARAKVEALDLSDMALKTAQENALRLAADIDFRKDNILNLHKEPTPRYDLIISNPPYICMKEKAEMEKNVVKHEPPEALFVEDDNPLIFYHALIDYATTALRPDGWLLFEINPFFYEEIEQAMRVAGFEKIETKNDFYERKRMTGGQR